MLPNHARILYIYFYLHLSLSATDSTQKAHFLECTLLFLSGSYPLFKALSKPYFLQDVFVMPVSMSCVPYLSVL